MNVSNANFHRQPRQGPDLGRDAGASVDTYVKALLAGDVDTALATLGPPPVLQSPFHTWRARHMPSVFRARCAAFTDLRIDTVIRSQERAVILWEVAVDGCPVQAAEVLDVSGGAISRLDVFLRPASVLEAVEKAMVRAWPT